MNNKEVNAKGVSTKATVSNYSTQSSKPETSVAPALEEAKIKKLGILNLALTFGLVGVFTGFLIGVFSTLASLLIPNLPAISIPGLGSEAIPTIEAISKFQAILIFPVVYGLVSLISGFIFGFFYNIACKITKGVSLYSG
jgi:hypothetical protein